MTSVVIVNFNGGRAAVENLRVIAERLPAGPSEIIVVDNASTDGSPDLIRRELPDLRLMSAGANRGYAAGVNLGLNAASGTTLVVMNPDVVPEPGALERLAEAVRRRRDFAVLGGSVVDGDGRVSSNCFRALPVPSDILRDGFFLRPRVVPRRGELEASRDGVVATEVVSGSVMALRRDSLDELGPMDEEFFLYNEDVEWCRRAHRKGLAVGLVTDALFYHEGGASTRTCEGLAFGARVLADFQYFCEGEGVAPETVRKLWRARLIARALLYRAYVRLGERRRRDESRRRAAVYRILASDMRRFRWSTSEGVQNGHPSRLRDFPDTGEIGDDRPTILQVIPDMEYGGAQRLVENIVTGSLSERFRFEILCLTHVGGIGETLRERGVRVHVAGLTGWRSRAGWRLARDYAALLEPDLVHSHTSPGDAAAHFGFRGRAPRLSTKHGVEVWMNPVLKLVEAWILRGATVLCVSDAVAAAKSCLGPWGTLPPVVQSPSTVSVAPEPAPLMVEERPVTLTMVGRLHRVKRIDIFLEAAAELERRRPGHFAFRVVGEGPESERLCELARTLGVGERVEFRGAVADVTGELDDSDIVLLLSDCEGLPLTILEMLARGRIPLIRRVPGTDDALPAALERCFVDSSSPIDVAEKVLEICDEPDLFVELACQGLRWVAERSDYASVTGRTYEGLLSTDSARSKTRVLHLITRLIVGGAQENTIASVERVDPERYDSQLWIGPQTGSEGSLLADARSRGIVVRVLPNLVREINPRRDALALVQLVRLLRRERFDIVHTHCSKAGIVGRIAAKLAGVPHIVHTLHGWAFHDRMHPIARRIYAASERMMELWTRPLVSVSNQTTEDGLEARIGARENYRLIRSGIPLDRFRPDKARGSAARAQLCISEGDVVIGSVGRLAPQKNPMDFVKLAELLLASHANLTFLYVGGGPMRGSVEAATAALGIADRVRLLGVRDDVPDLLRAMDVFVLTSLWEGLPRVVLQALATGVPVLAYDTAGIAEAVIEGKNGHLVPRGAVNEMAGLVERLITDSVARAEMGRAAADDFDPAFSEDGMIRDLEKLYDELTEASPGGDEWPSGNQRGREDADSGSS